MKATLTIEVPDDFNKGDGKKCPLYTGYNDIDHTTNNCKYAKKRRCFPCDCPLEIQEKLPSINGYNAKECSDFISKYLNGDEIHYYDDCGNKNELAFILYSARDLLDYYSDIGE